jgi:tetratricopeptide (TPR) repeat protein
MSDFFYSCSKYSLVERGITNFNMKYYYIAIENFSLALEIEPQRDLFLYRGMAQQELLNFDEAIKDFSRVIELDSNEVTGYYKRGYVNYLKTEYDAALGDLYKTIKVDSEHFEAYSVIGMIRVVRGSFDEAKDYYSKSIEINENHELAFRNRGLAEMSLEEYSKALNDFNRALELDPENYKLFLYAGSAKLRLGNNKAAINDFTTYLKFNSNDYQAYRYRAISKIALRDLEGALIDCDKAIVINPEFANVYFTRGGVNFDLKLYDLAIQDYTKSLELGYQELGHSYCERGRTQKEIGNNQAALMDLNKAIEMDSNNQRATILRSIVFTMVRSEIRKSSSYFTKIE